MTTRSRSDHGLPGLWAFVLALSGCTATSQEPVDYEAVLVSDAASIATVGDWSVRLTTAEIAFGPVYFCAAESGSATLCDSSIAEVATVASFDALAASPSTLGVVHGFTGTIRSASYDFGITWFPTQGEPTPALEAPGGHSMHFEGEATRGTTSFSLVVDVDLVPRRQGQTAVSTAPADATVRSSDVRLEIHFTPARWFEQLDRLNPDGVSYLDALAATAVPGAPVSIGPNSLEHRALLVGIKNMDPPAFVWVPQ